MQSWQGVVSEDFFALFVILVGKRLVFHKKHDVSCRYFVDFFLSS